MSQEEIEDVVQKTKTGGAQIVDLLGDGSAYYAPAKSTRITSYNVCYTKLLRFTICNASIYHVRGVNMLKKLFFTAVIVVSYIQAEPTILKEHLVTIHTTDQNGNTKEITIARESDIRCREVPFDGT